MFDIHLRTFLNDLSLDMSYNNRMPCAQSEKTIFISSLICVASLLRHLRATIILASERFESFLSGRVPFIARQVSERSRGVT